MQPALWLAGSCSPRFQFGIWYYLGIEGTCQAAEEVRSPGRSLPLGTMTGIITLLIAAALTWYDLRRHAALGISRLGWTGAAL